MWDTGIWNISEKYKNSESVMDYVIVYITCLHIKLFLYQYLILSMNNVYILKLNKIENINLLTINNLWTNSFSSNNKIPMHVQNRKELKGRFCVIISVLWIVKSTHFFITSMWFKIGLFLEARRRRSNTCRVVC